MEQALGEIFFMSGRDIVACQYSGLSRCHINAARTIEALGPIACIHVFYPHRFAFAGGMNELAVTHINAHMAECAAHGVEEHQIARLELFFIDFLGGLGLIIGLARQKMAHGVLVDGAYKAAAIKTCLCAGAPKAIGNTDHAHGRIDHGRGICCDRLPHGLQIGAETALFQNFGQPILRKRFTGSGRCLHASTGEGKNE